MSWSDCQTRMSCCCSDMRMTCRWSVAGVVTHDALPDTTAIAVFEPAASIVLRTRVEILFVFRDARNFHFEVLANVAPAGGGKDRNCEEESTSCSHLAADPPRGGSRIHAGRRPAAGSSP